VVNFFTVIWHQSGTLLEYHLHSSTESRDLIAIFYNFLQKYVFVNALACMNIMFVKCIGMHEYDVCARILVYVYNIQEEADGHTNMVINTTNFKTFVIAPNVYDYYGNVLESKGIKVIKGGKTLSRNYPEDIAYNVARIGRYAVHNTKHTDQVLKYYLEEAGIEFIHVNQGYTKCSIAPLSENKALTSDFLIYEKLISHNIDCMYINPKIVYLRKAQQWIYRRLYRFD
jgi:hypothetical protein